jgi:seryl-tRNA synthetase
MIDILVIRSNVERVRHICKMKGVDVDVDRLLAVDTELERCRERLDHLQRTGRSDDNTIGAGLRSTDRELADVVGQLRFLSAERDELWGRVPNLVADDTPPGGEYGGDVELRREGHPVAAGPARAHELVGSRLGILDLERGAAVAGSGFYFWRGGGAQLTWAIFSYAQDLLVRRGFTLMMTPVLVDAGTLFGTGYLPFFADQHYQIADSDLSLIATAEQTLVGYYRDTVLAVADLPLLTAACTPCFRTEAGAVGDEYVTRGCYRVHQFYKVEQVVLCRPEESEHWLEECQRNVEDVLRGLELPFRVVRVCLEDLAPSAYKKYDTQTWFPSFGNYQESHSNSSLTDYQTRRLGIQVRSGDQLAYPHTISCTAVTDRAALAVLENHVQDDGSVYVPKALRPYLGGLDRIEK